MKSARCLAVVATFLVVPSLSAEERLEPAKSPTGTWRLDYDFQGNAIHDEIRLSLGEKGKVTGKLYRNERKPIDVTDGTFSEGVVTFTVSGNANGTDWKTVYKGKVNGDEIEDGNVILTFNDESYEFPWRPKRIVEMDDLVGIWNLKIELPDGTVFEPTLTVSEKDGEFAGEYSSPRADEIEIKELSVKDNKMRMTISVDYEGQELVVKYRGRPYGDLMKGTFAYEIGDDSGEGEFIATRKPAKAAEAKPAKTKDTKDESPCSLD